VQQVRDMDELATALILFAELHPLGPGGLVSLHDSGGERQLMIDLADAARVPLTTLAADTVRALEAVIDPELPAVNPLDAWSRGGEAAAGQMSRSLTLMLKDPGAAMAVVAHDRAPDGRIYRAYIDYMEAAHRESGKPVALVAARQGSGTDRRAVRSTHRGLPVLDGLQGFLAGVRALFAYRDYCELCASGEIGRPPIVSGEAMEFWRRRLATGRSFDEHESLRLLAECGIDANAGTVVENVEQLMPAAAAIGFPLAAKTAMPGALHKTELRGVHLDRRDEAALLEAWRDLDARCGPRVLLAPMLDAGVEMMLGARRDPQFGQVVMFGFGGIHAELLSDVVFALPPFSAAWAEHCLSRLKLRALLDGVRGQAPADVAAFCEAAARFSVMVDFFGDALEEADVNPLIVGIRGCKAADALFVGRNGGQQSAPLTPS
jgi:acyl-CoA synthetase (NDP forming)